MGRIKEGVASRIEARVLDAEQMVLKKLIALSLIAASLVMLVLAVFYFLKEYTNLSNAFSFLILSLILLIAGLITNTKKGR